MRRKRLAIQYMYILKTHTSVFTGNKTNVEKIREGVSVYSGSFL